MKACRATKEYQEPNLKDGLVETSGCVGLRVSHLQVLSLGALKEWQIWSLDIKNAFLQADGSQREVFLLPPVEWDLSGTYSIWELHAPAYGLNNAPATLRRTLEGHSLRTEASLAFAGLKFQVQTFDPCLFFVYRRSGEAVGAPVPRNDDVLGNG